MNSYELAKVFGYLYKDEVTLIKKATNYLPKDATIINIGAGAGTGCLAMLEEREDIFVVTLDINFDGPLGSLTGELNALNNAGIDYKNRLEQILRDSKEVGKEWVAKVDMVFIDGDHSAEGVRGDIAAWLPHIKEGGLIIFHDYGERWPNVSQAVDELMKPNYKLFEHADTTIGFIV